MIGFFTIVSEGNPFTTPGRRIVVFFDNSDTIRRGSPVKVLGLTIGRVTSVHLIPIDEEGKMIANNSSLQIGQKTAIILELKKRVVFYENYEITIRSTSFLSSSIISINPGHAEKDEEGRHFQPIPILTFSSFGLFSKDPLQDILERRSKEEFVELQGFSSSDLLAGFSEMISENRTNVRDTIENISQIVKKINQGKGTLGILVNDDEMSRNANTLVNDAKIVVRELRESLEDTREQAPVNSFLRAVFTAF